MKKALILSGLVLLVLLVAAGGFWGGMRYESRLSERVRANFTNTRGPGEAGPLPQMGQLPGGEMPSGFMGGGGTMGQVKAVDGTVITVSTAQAVTTVKLTDATRIVKSVNANLAELQPGMRVQITGEKDQDGNITADQITILPDELTIEYPVDSPQTEAEP